MQPQIAQNDSMNNKKSTAGKVVGAGLVGTAVGVAIGAAAVAFSDKKTREKTLKTAKDLSKHASGTINTVSKKAQDYLNKTNKDVKKSANDLKDAKEELEKDL